MFSFVLSTLLGLGLAPAALSPPTDTPPTEAALSVEQAPAAAPGEASPADPAAPITLTSLLERALRSHPELGAFDAASRATAERAAAAGSLAHPSAGLAFQGVPVDSFSLRDDEMTSIDLSISQEIPWPGKRDLRREVEAKGGEVIAEEKAAWALSLAEEVTSTYARLWLATEREAIVATLADELARLATLAREGVAAGRSQADAIYAEVEVGKVREQLLALQEEQGAARARLQALLAVDAPLEGAVAAPPELPLPARDALVAGLDGHPSLRSLDKEREQARLQASLARKEKLPDPRVGLTYGVRPAFPDLVGIELEVPIPLFASSKEERLAAAAEADAEALGRRRGARRDALAAAVEAAWLRADTETSRLALIEEELLPGLRRGLEASVAAYLGGRLEFATVVNRQLEIFRYQMQSLQARAERLVALARLAAATGDLGLLAHPEGDLR